MANEQNLIPLNKRSKAEQRAIQSKAGKASGIARKRKKSMREAAQLLLSMTPTDEIMEELKRMNFKKIDCDNSLALVVAMFQESLKGSVKAAEFVRATAGEGPGAGSISSEVDNDPLTTSMYEAVQDGTIEKASADPDVPEK